MLNIDRVRGVMRAKYGSQIPKFEEPSGPLPKPNPISKGSILPEPKTPENLKTIPKIPDPTMQKFNDFLDKNADKSTAWKTRKAKMAAQGLDYTKSKTQINFENFADKASGALEGLGDKLGSTLGNIVNADNLFGIASQLIDTDVDINSKGIDSAMNLVSSINPAIGFGFKAINKLGAKTLDQFSIDQQLKSRMGSGYGGAYQAIDKGAEYGGKEVGMFTSSKKYKNAINKGKELQFAIGQVDSENQDRLGMIGDWNYQRQAMQNNGGFDFTLAAKYGGSLDQKINFIKSKKFKQIVNINTKQIEEFKEGGIIQHEEVEWEPIIDDIADYWEPVIDDISRYKEGGKTKEQLDVPEIEKTSQKNLIPEGALHKNKHHMEHTEGLTQKGIPVIDNEGEQQAEIELDEIIFTLEVTKKLEELYKENTDESAIEAGKLLVNEILFNTDDRTGLITKCEKGGKL